MDEIRIPKGDEGYAISLQLNDSGGVAKNCALYTTYKLQVWPAGADPEAVDNLIVDAAIDWNDASTGDGYYTVAAEDFDTAGTYHARVFLAYTDIEERLDTFAIVVEDDIPQSWEIVTLGEAKSHLRVDSTDDDFVITSMIKAACKYCEGFQRRTYITQTRYLWLDAFPSGDHIVMPYPPLQSITSILYYDTDDTEATFAATNYYVDAVNDPGRVYLNYGYSWPTTALRPRNGIKITYVAGYGTLTSSLPDMVRQAALMLIGHWYENRETVLVGTASREIEFAVSSLLWMERSF